MELYTQFRSGKRPFLPVDYVNQLVQSLPQKEYTDVKEYVFKSYYKINRKIVPRILETYSLQQQNTSTRAWTPSTHGHFSSTWKDSIFTFLCCMYRKTTIPQDVYLQIIDYLAPPPLTPRRHTYVHWIPRNISNISGLFEIKPYALQYGDPQEQVWKETTKVITEWKKKRRLFIHVWAPGWHVCMLRSMGPQWKKHPVQIIFFLIQHIILKGIKKYGTFELNVLTEGMYRAWGREKTLDVLYGLWEKVVNYSSEMAEGPLSDMICKCTMMHNKGDFKHIQSNFSSLFSASYLRFRFI